MDVLQLAPDEPLSPELVLVLEPEVRARVLAGLPLPAHVRPRPRLRAVEAVPAGGEPTAPSLWGTAAARAAALGAIFVAVTVVTLALSFLAHVLR